VLLGCFLDYFECSPDAEAEAKLAGFFNSIAIFIYFNLLAMTFYFERVYPFSSSPFPICAAFLTVCAIIFRRQGVAKLLHNQVGQLIYSGETGSRPAWADKKACQKSLPLWAS